MIFPDILFLWLVLEDSFSAYQGDGNVVALAIVNTILGASTGGLAVLFIDKFLFKKPWSFLMCLNGALAGISWFCDRLGGYSLIRYGVSLCRM